MLPSFGTGFSVYVYLLMKWKKYLFARKYRLRFLIISDKMEYLNQTKTESLQWVEIFFLMPKAPVEKKSALSFIILQNKTLAYFVESE